MTFKEIYDSHLRFVWRSLFRLGVLESDLPDAAQDVFVVVHRRLVEFEGRSKITTWLFGICMRVAADRRRFAHLRWEVSGDPSPEPASDGHDPTALLERQRARMCLRELLGRMSEEQRIVFTLFELEGLTGDEIAELLDVPVGTVRSRLRLAREVYEHGVERIRARESAHERADLITHLPHGACT